MKKIFWSLVSFVFAVQFANAQQQVWEHVGYVSNGYQIRNIASMNNKIIYAASSLEMLAVYAVTGNENGALLLDEFSEVSDFAVFGDKVVFKGRKDAGFNLWITDGTQQGTIQISNVGVGYIAVFNNKIYFTSGNTIYYTDGTLQGTQLLLSVPGTEGQIPFAYSILFLKVVNNKLIYYYYGQLGVSDGLSSTVEFLSDNSAMPITGAYATVEVVNNKLVFINASEDFGHELWTTDGTDANTGLLKDIYEGTSSSFEEQNHNLVPRFTESNGKLYFVANKGTGRSVWVTNGTLSGTSELYIGSNTNDPVSLKSIDGNVYFSNSYSSGFYFSDGLNNTVQNISGPQNPSDAYSFTKFNGSVYFVARDTDHGYELWKTDNTANSTMRVTDICKGSCSAFNHYTGLIACENILFFSASEIGYNDVEHPYGPEYQLWKLEGGSVTASIHNATIQKVNAYPNPCKESVSIAFQQSFSSVQLFSAVGNEIKANWQQDSNTLVIQTQALSPGMYKLLLNGKESVSIIKE